MQCEIDVFLVGPTMLRWGFERLLEQATADVRVVGSAPHIGQAAGELQDMRADVVAVDYDEVLEADTLRSARLRPPVLLLAPDHQNENLGHWTRAGVMAVFPKHGSAELLLFAIRSACGASCVERGHRIEPRRGGRHECVDERVGSLTVRERQLLFALVSNSATPGKVLASKLCISEHTLRNHLTSVYGKLGVHNRLSLHEYALRHHLGDDPRFLHP
jgi:two-component system, NarL family, nitrate/nitrite response regulator NarL